MKNFGLKLWSNDFIKNKAFADDCVELLKDGVFDYIELFALPNSFAATKSVIKEKLSGHKVIIHAPHSGFGVDTGDKSRFLQNCQDIKSSQEFADLLNSDIIILHSGGNSGEQYLAETIHQFNRINDSRIAVENLPAYCSSTQIILHGTSPAEIKRIIAETGCKFCLDFSHAICASNSFNRDVWADLEAYKNLNPCMYHICDGDISSTEDKHLHFGTGNYDLSRIVNDYISADSYTSMETGFGIPTSITPWVDDIAYLRGLVK